MLVVVLRHCETWRQNGSRTSWSRRRSFVYDKKLIDSASASKGTDAMRRYSRPSPRRSVTNKTVWRSHCCPSVCPWLFCEADGKTPKRCSSASLDFSTPPTLTRNGNPPAAICVPCGTGGGNIANNSRGWFYPRNSGKWAARASSPLALIGKSRAAEILANVVYPLAVNDDREIWNDYKKLRAQLSNQAARTAAARLFAGDPRQRDFVRSLVGQQGLLQIYEDFCLRDASDCASCPLPEQLQRW